MAARTAQEDHAPVFVDAVHVKIRDGQVANRPIYAAIGGRSAPSVRLGQVFALPSIRMSPLFTPGDYWLGVINARTIPGLLGRTFEPPAPGHTSPRSGDVAPAIELHACGCGRSATRRGSSGSPWRTRPGTRQAVHAEPAAPPQLSRHNSASSALAKCRALARLAASSGSDSHKGWNLSAPCGSSGSCARVAFSQS